MMMFMWFIPLAFVALAVVGVMWLVRAFEGTPRASAPTPTPPAGRVCPSCGRPIEAGWQHCPHCGQPLV